MIEYKVNKYVEDDNKWRDYQQMIKKIKQKQPEIKTDFSKVNKRVAKEWDT